MATPSQLTQQRPPYNARTRIYVVIVGLVAVSVYLEVLLGNNQPILGVMGFASVLVMIFLPILILGLAAQTTMNQSATVKPVQPISAYFRLALQRHYAYLAGAAIIAIPIFVFFCLYLQILLPWITTDPGGCLGYCSPYQTTVDLSGVIPQSLQTLAMAIGLWGMNLLACAIGVWLALKWHYVSLALIAGTILLVVVLWLMLYALALNVGISALVPYLLAFAIARLVSPPVVVRTQGQA